MNPSADIEHLDRGLHVPLTLILTPDGAPEWLGHWLAHHRGPWARYALTTADNRPEHFLANLTAALRAAVPTLRPILIPTETDPLDATAELLNALLAMEKDLAVILENYQTITTPAVHAAVRLMVDYPPPCVHLYLVSQRVPPLPLARLRVRQQLVEIDLRGE